MDLRSSLEGHEGSILCTRFSLDGRRVATGGKDKSIAVWSTRSGKLERRLEGHRRKVSALTVTSTGELVSGGSDGSVRVWSMQKGRELLTVQAHRGTVYTLGSSADGSLLASGGADDQICVWSRDDGELVHSFPVGPRGTAFVFAADGEHIVSGHGGDTLRFWSLETGELAYEQDAGPGMVGAFELDHSRQWAISRGWRGPVTVWSAESWAYTGVLPIVERDLSCAKLRPEYEQIVCTWQGNVGLFDGTTGESVAVGEHPCKGVYDLDVSADGNLAVTAAADGVARIWNLG